MFWKLNIFVRLKSFNNYTWIFLQDQDVQKHDVFSKKNAETTCMYYNFWELKNSKKMNLVFHNVQNAQKDELISIILEQKKSKSHETIFKAKDTI